MTVTQIDYTASTTGDQQNTSLATDWGRLSAPEFRMRGRQCKLSFTFPYAGITTTIKLAIKLTIKFKLLQLQQAAAIKLKTILQDLHNCCSPQHFVVATTTKC